MSITTSRASCETKGSSREIVLLFVRGRGAIYLVLTVFLGEEEWLQFRCSYVIFGREEQFRCSYPSFGEGREEIPLLISHFRTIGSIPLLVLLFWRGKGAISVAHTPFFDEEGGGSFSFPYSFFRLVGPFRFPYPLFERG